MDELSKEGLIPSNDEWEDDIKHDSQRGGIRSYICIILFILLSKGEMPYNKIMLLVLLLFNEKKEEKGSGEGGTEEGEGETGKERREEGRKNERGEKEKQREGSESLTLARLW